VDSKDPPPSGVPPRRPGGRRAEPFPAQRILVVDDNRDGAEALGALLERLGATVSVANDGREALNVLDTFDPEVVLLDIGMPGLDGYEVSRQIRAADGHSEVLLIALTGWGGDEDRAQSKMAGFDHHLVKPLDIDKLRSLLAEHAARAGR
jgi:CheY-like chemotaxis protein